MKLIYTDVCIFIYCAKKECCKQPRKSTRLTRFGWRRQMAQRSSAAARSARPAAATSFTASSSPVTSLSAYRVPITSPSRSNHVPVTSGADGGRSIPGPAPGSRPVSLRAGPLAAVFRAQGRFRGPQRLPRPNRSRPRHRRPHPPSGPPFNLSPLLLLNGVFPPLPRRVRKTFPERRPFRVTSFAALAQFW